MGNANANLGRPPRPPGFKKRPNTAGAQPMGGLPIEEFLAVMNGGGDSGDLVGKLMQLGISLASNDASVNRATLRLFSIDLVTGCVPPSTRRAIRSVSSSVVTASRRSSSVPSPSL